MSSHNDNLQASQNLADALANWLRGAMHFRVTSKVIIIPPDLPVEITGNYGQYPYTIRLNPATQKLTLKGNTSVRKSVIAMELTERYGQPDQAEDRLTWINVPPADIPSLDFSRTPHR